MSEGERANRKRAWRPLCGRALKVGPCTEPLNPETQSQTLIILAKKSTNWRIRLPFSSWAWIWFELATFYRKFHEKKSTDNSLSIYPSICFCKYYAKIIQIIKVAFPSSVCQKNAVIMYFCSVTALKYKYLHFIRVVSFLEYFTFTFDSTTFQKKNCHSLLNQSEDINNSEWKNTPISVGSKSLSHSFFS